MAGVSIVRSQAAFKTTEAMVSALVVRAKTGRMPKTIAEIPGSWIDPFSKKALRMVFVGDSTRIYSVGFDRVDSGGRTKLEAGKGSYSDDIIAAYPPLKVTKP